MVVQKRVPLAYFEDDYERFVAKKEKVIADLKAEFERKVSECTAKLDRLIDETSEIVEVEVPDEEVVDEQPQV